MKADKLLDKVIKLKVDDIIEDKIIRENREKNWSIFCKTKKQKIRWAMTCYLAERLTELEKLEVKIRVAIIDYRKKYNLLDKF